MALLYYKYDSCKAANLSCAWANVYVANLGFKKDISKSNISKLSYIAHYSLGLSFFYYNVYSYILDLYSQNSPSNFTHLSIFYTSKCVLHGCTLHACTYILLYDQWNSEGLHNTDYNHSTCFCCYFLICCYKWQVCLTLSTRCSVTSNVMLHFILC